MKIPSKKIKIFTFRTKNYIKNLMNAIVGFNKKNIFVYVIYIVKMKCNKCKKLKWIKKRNK
jgi:hypothetical protein